MTRGTKQIAWAVGLLAGAAGIGGLAYVLMKPKQTTAGGGTTTTPPPPPPGTKPTTFVTPTATPGIFAAVSPGLNVSWVDPNGKPVGQGGGGGDVSTSRLPK